LTNSNGWWVVADSKKVGPDGWLENYNPNLRKARKLSDAGTHWVITKKIKRHHFQIWVKKKLRPSKPRPWFNLRRIK